VPTNLMKTNSCKKTIALALTILFYALFGLGCSSTVSYPGSSSGNQPSQNSFRVPSAQDNFTIIIGYYNDYDAEQLAQEFRKKAQELLQVDEVWIQREKHSFYVNYGRFKKYSDAQKKHKSVHKIYKSAYIREITKPDPRAPAEWNLLNSSCVFSLEIGTYYNVPSEDLFNRKINAVQAVRNLREQGEPAFFLHEITHSRVYVGCFPASVIQKEWVGDNLQTLISPSAMKWIKKYPYYHENGMKKSYKKIVKGVKSKKAIPYRSRLINVRLIKEKILSENNSY